MALIIAKFLVTPCLIVLVTVWAGKQFGVELMP